jgi:O-methyltransferase
MRLSRLVNKALRPCGLELRRVQPGEPMREHRTRPNKRLLYFQHLVELIEDVPGDIVECGVGAGKTLYMLAALTAHGKNKRHLWGFDSFEGLPPPTPEDEPGSAPQKIRGGMYAHSENEVRARLISYGVTNAQLKRRFTFVKGFFPETFPRYPGGPIALLHIDVDLYQSNRDCLEWFEPLVVPGGVIAFDEYRNPAWVGATLAIDQYFGGSPPGIRKAPIKNRWFLIKG